MYPLVFLVVLSLCLFLLYILSKQDFVLLRQNISLAQIFDAQVLSLISGFILGRIFYVINYGRFDLIHPLKFFHLIKYEGIIPLGFFGGMALLLFTVFGSKKGLGRIYDIFAIAFFPLFAAGLLLRYVNIFFLFPVIIFIALATAFLFLIRSHYKYILRDGSISFIFLSLLALDGITYDPFLYTGKNTVLGLFSLSSALSILILILSLIALTINQRKKAF